MAGHALVISDEPGDRPVIPVPGNPSLYRRPGSTHDMNRPTT